MRGNSIRIVLLHLGANAFLLEEAVVSIVKWQKVCPVYPVQLNSTISLSQEYLGLVK